MEPLDGLALFNLVEATIWFAFGVGLLGAATFRPPGAHLGVQGGVAFLWFGVSDLVEMHTGAWFRPWWLLVWKALCILVLCRTWWRYRTLMRDEASDEPE